MQIAIASDHAGFEYKEQIKHQLQEWGHEVHDFGTNSTEPVDYPDYIRLAASAVANGDFERGVVLGGSGNGEAMMANRYVGVRCALCWNIESAELARRHNDANMISIGQRLIEYETALALVATWIKTPFEEGRHVRRIQKLDVLSPS